MSTDDKPVATGSDVSDRGSLPEPSWLLMLKTIWLMEKDNIGWDEAMEKTMAAAASQQARHSERSEESLK
jgi:hypothetical protein